jgi:hypothetical protein
MVLTACFVLSLVSRASCHHPQCDAQHRHQVDASVGASGPHDFAVRLSGAFVFRATSVHRIPRPRVVTIAIRPSLVAQDGQASKGDLPDGLSEIFFTEGLDSDFEKLPDGQITCGRGRRAIDVSYAAHSGRGPQA